MGWLALRCYHARGAASRLVELGYSVLLPEVEQRGQRCRGLRIGRVSGLPGYVFAWVEGDAGELLKVDGVSYVLSMRDPSGKFTPYEFPRGWVENLALACVKKAEHFTPEIKRRIFRKTADLIAKIERESGNWFPPEVEQARRLERIIPKKRKPCARRK